LEIHILSPLHAEEDLKLDLGHLKTTPKVFNNSIQLR